MQRGRGTNQLHFWFAFSFQWSIWKFLKNTLYAVCVLKLLSAVKLILFNCENDCHCKLLWSSWSTDSLVGVLVDAAVRPHGLSLTRCGSSSWDKSIIWDADVSTCQLLLVKSMFWLWLKSFFMLNCQPIYTECYDVCCVFYPEDWDFKLNSGPCKATFIVSMHRVKWARGSSIRQWDDWHTESCDLTGCVFSLASLVGQVKRGCGTRGNSLLVLLHSS